MNCQVFDAIKKVKHSQDQRCADIIQDVINQSSRAASVKVEHINKAVVIKEFLISNGLPVPKTETVNNNKEDTETDGPKGWTLETLTDGTKIYTNPNATHQTQASKAASYSPSYRENKAATIGNFIK